MPTPGLQLHFASTILRQAQQLRTDLQLLSLGAVEVDLEPDLVLLDEETGRSPLAGKTRVLSDHQDRRIVGLLNRRRLLLGTVGRRDKQDVTRRVGRHGGKSFGDDRTPANLLGSGDLVQNVADRVASQHGDHERRFVGRKRLGGPLNVGAEIVEVAGLDRVFPADRRGIVRLRLQGTHHRGKHRGPAESGRNQTMHGPSAHPPRVVLPPGSHVLVSQRCSVKIQGIVPPLHDPTPPRRRRLGPRARGRLTRERPHQRRQATVSHPPLHHSLRSVVNRHRLSHIRSAHRHWCCRLTPPDSVSPAIASGRNRRSYDRGDSQARPLVGAWRLFHTTRASVTPPVHRAARHWPVRL